MDITPEQALEILDNYRDIPDKWVEDVYGAIVTGKLSI